MRNKPTKKRYYYGTCKSCCKKLFSRSRASCRKCYFRNKFVDPKERFLDKVEKTNKCWIFKGGRVAAGYGSFYVNNKSIGAHRFSWEMHRNSIPRGSHVLHKCDVRSCVNPKHLFLGTHSENMKDMIKKKRQAFGERQGSSKLSFSDVSKIRKLYCLGKYSQSKIGKMFNVNQTVISHIVTKRTWSLARPPR